MNSGIVDTPLAKPLGPVELVTERLVAKTALGRMAQPEEIAKCILFLLSDESSFVNASVSGFFACAGLLVSDSDAYKSCRFSMLMAVSSKLQCVGYLDYYNMLSYILSWILNHMNITQESHFRTHLLGMDRPDRPRYFRFKSHIPIQLQSLSNNSPL